MEPRAQHLPLHLPLPLYLYQRSKPQGRAAEGGTPLELFVAVRESFLVNALDSLHESFAFVASPKRLPPRMGGGSVATAAASAPIVCKGVGADH